MNFVTEKRLSRTYLGAEKEFWMFFGWRLLCLLATQSHVSTKSSGRGLIAD